MLKEVEWPESRQYTSRSEWEPIGFFSECLCNAVRFDLKLGFFSSSAINILADGFATFLFNGGRMRMIINDILSSEDKQVIADGTSNSCIVSAFDLNNLENIVHTLSERGVHFFECLVWLIRNKRIEIRIIVPKDSFGISHFKCGLFGDGVNKVAFNGSCNFSRTALIENSESLSAFCNWDGRVDESRVDSIEKDFESTFNEQDDTVSYILPEQLKERIAKSFAEKEIEQLLKDEERIINDSFKKDIPSTVKKALSYSKERVKKAIEQIQIEKDSPHFPYPSGPFDYQTEAFNKWKENNQKGLFCMATGTGKTITSLNCLLQVYNRYKYYKAIILVPTITLVNQWADECRKFNFNTIIKVYSKNTEWYSRIERLQQEEKYRKEKDPQTSFIIISTYASFTREKVFSALNSFDSRRVLLIADEAHNMGSPQILKRFGSIVYARRIGLSATPERQFDKEINKRLFRFFGALDHYTFEYTMREAIDNGRLCRYFYYPHVVRLTEEEMDKYMELSLKIAQYFNYTTNSFDKKDDILMKLLLARKRIIHKAVNKLEVFRDIIQKRYEEKGNLKYTLVYVPEGSKPEEWDDYDLDEVNEVDDSLSHLIDVYTRVISQMDKFITIKKFVAGQTDRERILADFASGKLQVLTSMKCLDEGVDVPRSEMAIFCSSTGNPRQFIQRRGRILRTHKDKKYAIIHDLVVVPEISSVCDSYKMEQALLRNELERVKDFALLSENSSHAQMELYQVMHHYGLNLYNNNHI